MSWPPALLADAVLLLHFSVVLFVVGGLVLVLAANRFAPGRWRWVNSLGFRATHALAIVVIASQAWLGRYCPLTLLESWLRAQAGQAPYQASFVQHWVERVMYFNAPLWAFALAYTAFAAVVAWAWWVYPPRRRQVA